MLFTFTRDWDQERDWELDKGQWVLINYSEVSTLLRDRGRDLILLFPIVPVPFPLSFSVSCIVINSAIHQVSGKTVHSFAWYNSCGTKQSLKLCMGERSFNTIPAGGRQSGGLVNSALSYKRAKKPIWIAQLVEESDLIMFEPL